jgi:hypothetical protein
LPLNSENFDPNNFHSTVTNNSRITPTVAGKYDVLGQVAWATNANDWRNISIKKNNTTFFASSSVMAVTAPGIPTTQEVSAEIDMNGTTDYVELLVSAGVGAGAASILGGSVFNGGLTVQPRSGEVGPAGDISQAVALRLLPQPQTPMGPQQSSGHHCHL